LRVDRLPRERASVLLKALTGLIAVAITGLAGILTLAAPAAARPRARVAAHRSTHSSAKVTTVGSGGVGLGQATTVPGAALGPTQSTPSHPVVPGLTAAIIHGVAYAPAGAPLAVKRAIWAGNQIRHKPYIYGGGHASFIAPGYDCSGSVSYVLHAAGLLSTPMDSSDFMGWGQNGVGSWITVYTNPAHAFVEIAGIRLDTSSEGDPGAPSGSGPRWRPLLQDTSAFAPRHVSSL
jgi:hypothetical protein